MQWYQQLHRAENVKIERWENFQKQTFRNRCLIAAANGVQALTVPVKHGDTMLIKDLRISDHGNWRHLHWNAIQSAYGKSPFFDYYEDDLRPFFEQRWDFLLDFNEAIRQKMCELIDIQPDVSYTKSFRRISDVTNSPDENAGFEPKPYYQVYRQKHGFLPNLSILDLLLNMGPESIFYL